MDFKSYVEASESNEADECELDNSDEVLESDSEQSIHNDEQRNKLSDDFYSRFGFVEIESENLNAETMHRHLIHDSFKIKEPDYEDVQVCKYATLPEKISEDPSTSEAHSLESTSQDENVLLINPRALSKAAKTYELEKFEKKLLVIFNQFYVDGYKYPRYGTHEDAKVLTNTFEKLGFEVVEHTDYTRDEIFAELKTFTSKNFVDYGCVAVAVLTHGSHHGLLRAKDDQYSEQVIIEHLKVHNNPTLITKPKMLIIQACRGDMSLKGVEVYKQTGRMHTDAFEEVEHYSLPIAADMVVVHSTFFGNPANRCLVTGSWFIQTFCEKIDLLAAEMDFEAIFKEVQNTIAIEKVDPVYNRLTQAMDINKQMPTILSSLIRKLYLRKFMESSTDSSDFQMTQENLTPVTPMPATPSEEPSSLTTKVSFATEVTMQYFDYLKECLRRYVEENSEDKIAQSLFMVADTFGNGKKFNESKKKMCSAICQHLISNSEKIPHYQHLFICESYLL